MRVESSSADFETGTAASTAAIEIGDVEAISDLARAIVASRQNISPKRLDAPGPDDAQLAAIFEAAAAAPDHGLLRPWRFVLVPREKRALLAEAFALALVDRDATATLEQIESARAKAYRAPLLILAVARLGRDEEAIPDADRLLSLGCAVQNMLLVAHSLGFGAGLTSGQSMRSARLRTLFGLTDDEQAVCFVNIGTVTNRKPLRVRPRPDAFTTSL
jgi:nitroreductase